MIKYTYNSKCLQKKTIYWKQDISIRPDVFLYSNIVYAD